MNGLPMARFFACPDVNWTYLLGGTIDWNVSLSVIWLVVIVFHKVILTEKPTANEEFINLQS